MIPMKWASAAKEAAAGSWMRVSAMPMNSVMAAVQAVPNLDESFSDADEFGVGGNGSDGKPGCWRSLQGLMILKDQEQAELGGLMILKDQEQAELGGHVITVIK